MTLYDATSLDVWRNQTVAVRNLLATMTIHDDKTAGLCCELAELCRLSDRAIANLRDTSRDELTRSTSPAGL